MQNKERMLHFDVSLGCTSQTIIDALADLNQSQSTKEFTRTEVAPSPNTRFRPRPAWARNKSDDKEKQSPQKQSSPEFRSAWLRGETGTLLEVEKQLESLQSNPVAFAIATKVLATLKSSVAKSSGLAAEAILLPGLECAQIAQQTSMFAELIAAIDPSGITASKVAISFSNEVDSFHQGWLLTLAEEIPTIDRLWPAPYCDYLGLAFLKSVAVRFGALGESVIDRHGTGQTPPETFPRVTTRALLCSLPEFSSRVSSHKHTPPLPLVEITATLGQSVNTADLLRRMQNIGCKSLLTWQAFEASTYPRMILRALVSHDSLDRTIELLLVTGEALQLMTTAVESPSLQQRVVSVPYGHRQKMRGCRVNESLWSGKVIRVDPDPDDLAQIVQETGFAQDIVRADILAAWRKWRADMP